MPSFRKPERQARDAMKRITAIGRSRHRDRKEGHAHSLRTADAYRRALTGVARWLREQGHLDGLRKITPELAQAYLEERRETVGQKALDLDRQALQAVLGIKLPVVRSHLSSGRLAKVNRAYNSAQVQLIAENQRDDHALATRLAHAAGLRAHELLTLRRASERPPSAHRTWRADRFYGRSGVRYTVVGKGGLIREVLLPKDLAAELEARRLDAPRTVMDRGIRYEQHYAIAGGKSWSMSFTRTAQDLFGESYGAHGLRHGYAQERMEELQRSGHLWDTALRIVSQELGHFRPDITLAYLR